MRTLHYMLVDGGTDLRSVNQGTQVGDLCHVVDDASGVAEVGKHRTPNIELQTPKLKIADAVLFGAILVALTGYGMVIGYWLVIHFLS